MTDRIFIKDIARELGYKDYRSVRRWCENHDVTIFSDKGCNRKFVLKRDFEFAIYNNVSDYHSQKFGNNEIPKNFSNSENKRNNLGNINKQNYNYIPTGTIEKKFLESSIFTNA